MQALKESISLASRHGPPTLTTAGPQRFQSFPPRSLFNSPKGSCPFDVMDCAIDVEDQDSSIEIIGPVPFGVAPSKSKLTKMSLATHAEEPPRLFDIQKRVQTNSVLGEKQDKKVPDGPADKVPALPIYSYKDYSPAPTMVYTCHEEEANDLVQTLKGPVGFDMEWRVLFYPRAPERPTAVVQVCDKNIILLIHISSMSGFPEKLRDLIESKDIPKIGVNILNDGRKLFRDFGILANNLVELSALAKQADPKFDQTFGLNRTMVSLAKIVANYCGKILPKGKERTGNWEGKLGPNMLTYAANDAHCALVVYQKLLSQAAEHERDLSSAGYTNSVTFKVLEYNAPTAPKLPPPTGTTTSSRTGFVRSQHLRAYSLWYRDKLPLQRICAKLRSEAEPLKESTVISYVIGALESNSSLPFDMTKLIALVRMETGSWRRHREFIMKMEREGRGRTTQLTNR